MTPNEANDTTDQAIAGIIAENEQMECPEQFYPFDDCTECAHRESHKKTDICKSACACPGCVPVFNPSRHSGIKTKGILKSLLKNPKTLVRIF